MRYHLGTAGAGHGNIRWIYALCAVAFAVVLFNQLTRVRPPARERVVSTDTLISYARDTLDELQARSIERNQEFCGVIYEDELGNLKTSRVYEGDRAAYALDWGVPLGNHVVASFHTHAAHDLAYDSEVPSVEDMATDIDARIDGFVSTPGGRLWHVDWREEDARQVCGAGCLESDPDYVESVSERVPTRLTIADLQGRMTITTSSP